MLISPSKSPTFAENSVVEALTRRRDPLIALFVDLQDEMVQKVGRRDSGNEIDRNWEVNLGIFGRVKQVGRRDCRASVDDAAIVDFYARGQTTKWPVLCGGRKVRLFVRCLERQRLSPLTPSNIRPKENGSHSALLHGKDYYSHPQSTLSPRHC